MMHQEFLNRFGRVWVFTFLCMVCAGFSASAAPQETDIRVTGEVTVLYADDFEGKRSELLYRLKERHGQRTFDLRVPEKLRKKLKTGAVVSVRGRARGRELSLAANGTEAVETIQPAAVPVAGEQRTVILVADFLDAGVSCSVDTIRDLMFTDPGDLSVDDFYQETSLGEVTLGGEVAGPYTIDYRSTGACDPQAWATAVEAKAQLDGVDLGAYDRRLYVLPRANPCGWAGLGTVGGRPSRAWVLTCGVQDVYAHELGHNLGMHHAATESNEYGDTSDVMGYGGYGLRQVNAPHQEQMGWRTAEQILSVTSGGLYEIAPLEFYGAETTLPQILTIEKPDTGDRYYLSYRQPLGFDANLNATYLERLNIHRYDGNGSRTYLLRTLADGERFVDAANGVTITQESHADQSVTVAIQLDGTPPVCMPDAPSLNVNPGSLSGQAGETLEYTVSVTNTDSAECAPSDFSLSATLPGGWTGSVSPEALTLSPGQRGSATLRVSSPSGASPASYQIGLQIADPLETRHGAAAAATCTLTAGPGNCQLSTVADVQVNGQDCPLSMSAGSPVSFTLGVTAGELSGTHCDWWAVLVTPFGNFWFGPRGWVRSNTPVILAQLPLMDLQPVTLFRAPLPAGSYRLIFVLDNKANGVLDRVSWYDSVTVTVQ